MGGLENFRIRKPSGTPKGGTSGWAHSAQAATLCRIDTSHETWFRVGGPEGHKVRHYVACVIVSQLGATICHILIFEKKFILILRKDKR